MCCQSKKSVPAIYFTLHDLRQNSFSSQNVRNNDMPAVEIYIYVCLETTIGAHNPAPFRFKSHFSVTCYCHEKFRTHLVTCFQGGGFVTLIEIVTIIMSGWEGCYDKKCQQQIWNIAFLKNVYGN